MGRCSQRGGRDECGLHRLPDDPLQLREILILMVDVSGEKEAVEQDQPRCCCFRGEDAPDIMHQIVRNLVGPHLGVLLRHAGTPFVERRAGSLRRRIALQSSERRKLEKLR